MLRSRIVNVITWINALLDTDGSDDSVILDLVTRKEYRNDEVVNDSSAFINMSSTGLLVTNLKTDTLYVSVNVSRILPPIVLHFVVHARAPQQAPSI